jgi:hypothetical protein
MLHDPAGAAIVIMLRPPSASTPSSIIANACASSQRSNWSMNWNRKRP